MDPLSIIASIAGIATAGAQLSSTLFRVYKTVRHAPREIQSVAIEMAGLSVTLEHLHDIFKTGQLYTKPSFLDAVRHVVKNIEATQKEIFSMVNENTIIVRLKWLKAAKYLSEIDKQKVTLTLQITILSAAILVKSSKNESSSVQEKVDNRFRLQAESVIQSGQASFQREKLDVPKQNNDEPNSAMIKHATLYSPTDSHNPEDDTQECNDDYWGYKNNHGRATGYDPLAGRVAQFGQNFHLYGDAATFLYNLVFMTEVVQYGKAPQVPGSSDATREGSQDESPYYSDDDFSTDTEGLDKADEPARVVNQLLLAWTSLSQSEIEKDVADEEDAADDKDDKDVTDDKPIETQSSYSRKAYVESDDESDTQGMKSSQGTSNWPHAESHSMPGSPNSMGYRNEIPKRDAYRRGTVRPFERPYHYNYNQPGVTAPSANNTTNTTNRNRAKTTNYRADNPQEPPSKASSKLKFQKPHVVVLPYADAADSEIGAMTPKLDVSTCQKMSIVRQDEVAIWNSDDHNSKNSVPGKSIMGVLIGDKTARNPHGLDLAHTLMQGQDMKLIYIRGNELGETWFINEQPVFLQFFHCGYIPQFYPTKESEITAMKQEYVAVGEEWASFEALNQLGLPSKGRDEGRVLLDPNTTWSMVKELAITTLQLRSMRQRRLYTPTFYNSTATFRLKHCGAIPEQSAVGEYPDDLLRLLKTQAEVKLGGEQPHILKFLVKDEGKKKEVAKSLKVETQNTQPRITITPPPTPQENSSPDLYASDRSSKASSRSRLSRFVHRYRYGRKEGQLSPPLQRYSSKSSDDNTVREDLEDDDKRPVTPADSGVGSSLG
ncbi:hypothetical protein FCULG_00007432 [Fusarium culmorum]|uniref:Fungal N-terminal domain-containing protein n=1 Tax=Fusarium culmorum TaxID=5516 RepID=A0A2T4H0Z6_FUSCU|nr:hypothetical protein FCULG_00007432 [Fusarium culmorum]